MYKLNLINIAAFCLLVLVTQSLVSCTWVKQTPESEKVRLVPADRVVDCTRIGSVTTSTVNKVVINRNAAKVKTELETLAGIEAAQMDGDTIVATSEVVEGRQTYDVYKCLK
ncbi:MAG: DUF4156 domain-containing protein [Gammaproteobacteria bacterium]|nr:DUF4156 domain-containing protein [Gammaproteobacteria bacterium]